MSLFNTGTQSLSRRAIWATVLSLGIALIFESAGSFQTIDLQRLDLWLRDVLVATVTSREEVEQGLVVVAVDEASLQKVGRWPWSWNVHARIVDELMRLGARAVAFDVVFPASGEGAMPPGREPFVAALRRSGKVLLATAAGVPGSGNRNSGVGLDPYLAEAAAGVGAVGLPADLDGAVRTMSPWLWVRAGVGGSEVTLASFDLAVAAFHLASPLPDSASPHVALTGPLGKRILPLRADGRTAYIRWRGEPPAYPSVSCSDLLEGRVPRESVKRRTAIVGFTAQLMQDRFPTPHTALTGQRTAGVEIHAQAIGTLLAGDGLQDAAATWQCLLRYLAAVFGGLILVIAGPLKGSVLLLFGVTSVFGGAAWAYHAGTILELARPMVLPVLAFLVVLGREHRAERQRAEFIRGMFSHYLNPSVVDWLVNHPEGLRLGGERRTLTVLFSDIRGFTTLSEELTAESLVKLLNEYLGAMTTVVFRHQGTLDKYVGDALMAVYGAPVDQQDHAARACRTALEMTKALRLFNLERRRQKLPELDIGIGVNSGEMVVGNMGSPLRFDYTVLGDAVNLAARLEGQTKSYGVQTIVGEGTRQLLDQEFLVRELDLIRVKGKREPARVYQLLGLREDLSNDEVKAHDIFREGLESYRNSCWDKAISQFERVLAVLPDDGPSRLFIERCDSFRLTPPPANWGGIHVASSK